MSRIPNEARERVINRAKQAKAEADRALDSFAAGKDDEAAEWLSMVRDDINSALRTLAFYRDSQGPTGHTG